MRWVPRQQNDTQRLNDEFRQAGAIHTGGGRRVITRGITALGPIMMLEAVRQVQRFDRFMEDTGPYGVRDFGAFDLVGERLPWEIDCYNRTLDAASPTFSIWVI